MSTYSNAHAKVKNLIFDVLLPGKKFEFGIILNPFWSFIIWAIQIHFSFAEFKFWTSKMLKIPGFNLAIEINGDVIHIIWSRFKPVYDIRYIGSSGIMFSSKCSGTKSRQIKSRDRQNVTLFQNLDHQNLIHWMNFNELKAKNGFDFCLDLKPPKPD